jgi:hypothetical protein
MAKKEDFKYNIESVLGSVKESPTSDWCKLVLRMTWNDNPSTLDIRNVKMNNDNKIIGKGISLSNEEADRLVEVLLDNSYGSLEALEKAIKKRRSFFTVESSDEDFGDDEGEPMRININL